MKIQKRIGGGAVAVVTSTALLALTVVAGGAPAGARQLAKAAHAAASRPSIWYINPLTAYPLFNDSAAVFKAAAAKDGYSATVVGSSTINIPQQITLIKQAESSGAKAIIFCDLDPKTYRSTIMEAEAKGIVMITTSCTDTISDYSVGTDNVAFGQKAAQTIAQNVGPAANVATFGVNMTVPNQAASYNAFVAYAKKHYPKMKVSFIADQGSPSTTATDLESLPQAYPKTNAIWFLEGGDDSIIASSLQHAKKKPGAYYVLAIDAMPTTLAEIKSGYVSETLAQCYFWATPFTAQLALAKLAGKGPTKQSWNIPVQVVGKKQLPYSGCPSSFYPKVAK